MSFFILLCNLPSSDLLYQKSLADAERIVQEREEENEQLGSLDHINDRRKEVQEALKKNKAQANAYKVCETPYHVETIA